MGSGGTEDRQVGLSPSYPKVLEIAITVLSETQVFVSCILSVHHTATDGNIAPYADAPPASRAIGGTQAALTAYGVAKASEGRISLTTIYRRNRNRGRVANFDGELLEALCDVFIVGPGTPLEREGHGKTRKITRRAAEI